MRAAFLQGLIDLAYFFIFYFIISKHLPRSSPFVLEKKQDDIKRMIDNPPNLHLLSHTIFHSVKRRRKEYSPFCSVITMETGQK